MTLPNLIKFIFLIIPLFPSILYSQLNESDTISLKANLSLTGFWQAGNVQTTIFRARSEVSLKPVRGLVFTTKNSYVYKEFGQSKADEDVLSLNFLYYKPKQKVSPFALSFSIFLSK